MDQQYRREFLQVLTILTKLIEMKDSYTEGHSEQVSLWSEIISRKLGLSQKEQEEIKLAAKLHDIGKIGIPDRILKKPAKLSEEEYAEVRKHSSLGADLFSNIDSLKKISKIIKHHHEWYNGKGYPDGLRGEEIPVGSRIINVADAYQAMTSNRPYRKAFSKEKAIDELKRCAGTQFDPEIVRIFIEILNENIS
ncbi:HD-GYP domain-containing protein [Candidatus Aerophobetes bacterium]|nr:HD-GYP domain-containing protein [Candidatus Aerophobetes bacterium]